jgi:hypothetical protein
MAEKKYLDLTQLTTYDTKLKAVIDSNDATALKAAKDYADGLGANYDATGTAKTLVDALANGQVKDNKDAIAILKGTGEGSVAKAVSDAKSDLEAKITAADTKAAGAQTAAEAAQADADALEAKVGAVDEGQTVMGIIKNIQANAYDDTAIKALIKTNADDIDALEGRATAVEGEVTTLIGDDASKSVRTIANEELVKQLIAEDADVKLDTLQEIAAWIQQHPKDASAMNAAIEALKTKVGNIPEGATSDTIVAYIQEVVDAEKSRAEGAESGIAARVTTLEGKFSGDNSVDNKIAAAKSEAIAAAATDAETKAGTAKTEAVSAAKTYTDDEVAKVKATADGNATDVAGLKTRMTTAESDIDALQAAIGTDGSVTAAIADAKKAGTDAATAVTTLENGQVKTNKEAIASNAAKITALESKVGDGFVAITEAEINALFATPQA